MSGDEGLGPERVSSGGDEAGTDAAPGSSIEPHDLATGASTPPSQPSGSRVSRVWIGSSIGLVILIVILVFILQNLVSVAIHFPGATVRLPVGIAILFGVILGGLLVFVLGLGRVLQLRHQISQHRHAHHAE